MTALELPTPPACPTWCDAEHGPNGWDESETKAGELTSVSKSCKRSVDFISTDSGYVEVVLDRLAAADLTGEAWGGVYVCDTYVLLLSDAPVIMTLAEADSVADATMEAVTLSRGEA